MSSPIEWKKNDAGAFVPYVNEQEVAWAPQPGSQEKFINCPVFEVLLHGPRGTGKSSSLLMDYAQHIGRGFGPAWNGIIFRKSYPSLADIINESKKIFPRIWPKSNYNEQKSRWTWPEGEQLKFAQMETPDDYTKTYHGQQFTFIGWEELTTYHDDQCYRIMMSCCRSPHPGIPKKYRATTNSYGVGAAWVKRRFRLGGKNHMVGSIIKGDYEGAPSRVAIYSTLEENKVLLATDPHYIERIKQAARNPAELSAWTTGSWDVTAGGMFDDLWDSMYHVIPDIPLSEIPKQWRVNRSYDHGQSHPFSVGWWARSNGEPVEVQGRVVGEIPGDVIRVAEWYGWTGKPNEGLRMSALEIGSGIRDREEEWGLRGRVMAGPADSSIYDHYVPGKTVAGDMARCGIRWQAADKGRGSRKHGWEQVRKYLRGSIPLNGCREQPGVFFCQRCDNAIRILPTAPRDSKDLDDVDTKSEDHVLDEIRYRLREKILASKSWSW